MTDKQNGRVFHISINDRVLSVVVFSLFFSWMLAFPFQGQILFAATGAYGVQPLGIALGAVAATFTGLFLCGFFIKTVKSAKMLMLGSIIFCFFATCVFFFPPSFLWTAAITSSAFLAGCCVAAWGFFLKRDTPYNERIKTIADGLIGSNVLMILLNMLAIHLSPRIGLGSSILMLALAFFFALRFSTGDGLASSRPGQPDAPVSIVKSLAFLCLFVIVITINSGLMYQVLNPAYAHLEWLTSWYWAIPYIVALYIMRNLPRSTNRTYILYVAIAMIGFSFIFFLVLDRSATGYLVVNTLMLGACGVYDLFWWSILGGILEYGKNPAKILGIGLSANVLGVILGGLIGIVITAADAQGVSSSILALAVVCVTLIMLPVLHKHLTALLKDHAYLTVLSAMAPEDQDRAMDRFAGFEQLTEREREITALLFKGKTYRMVAGELHLSENTVKTHIKNIYSKFKIQSRAELVSLMMEAQEPDDGRPLRCNSSAKDLK